MASLACFFGLGPVGMASFSSVSRPLDSNVESETFAYWLHPHLSSILFSKQLTIRLQHAAILWSGH
ncbi:hypothetical protein BDV32DRAFT_117193 [Aspergillus pseudonomiae]|nr:hypothetical protein BDV32DRAFT_117193 [Aspergillus pseudonomiae]